MRHVSIGDARYEWAGDVRNVLRIVWRSFQQSVSFTAQVERVSPRAGAQDTFCLVARRSAGGSIGRLICWGMAPNHGLALAVHRGGCL